MRLAAALLGIVVVALAVAAAGNALTPAGNKVVRVAAGSGFWLLITSSRPVRNRRDHAAATGTGPARALCSCLFVAAAGLAFAHGTFDNLSVMREYAVNAGRFAREARQHVAARARLAGRRGRLSRCRSASCATACRDCAPAILGTLNLDPDDSGDRAVRHPDGAARRAGRGACRWPRSSASAASARRPAVIALFLYSLLPVVANTVAGLERVSPAAVEAARGMGMTRRQILTGVELPLALPVILTGIRIVLVQNIGLVTIAALIGGGGLGTFVFQGIGQTAIDLVLLGALSRRSHSPSPAAVVLDALVEVMDRATAMIAIEHLLEAIRRDDRRRRRVAATSSATRSR